MRNADRRCGNCRSLSPGGACRHLGALAGQHRGPWGLACAWHRTDDEAALPAPCQLAPRDDLGRMFEANWPRGHAERRGWSDAAAHEAGVKLIVPPRLRRRALPYTQTK